MIHSILRILQFTVYSLRLLVLDFISKMFRLIHCHIVTHCDVGFINSYYYVFNYNVQHQHK
jgi:hypothetical protein